MWYLMWYRNQKPLQAIDFIKSLAEAVTVQEASVILRECTATHEIQRVTCILSPPFTATIR